MNRVVQPVWSHILVLHHRLFTQSRVRANVFEENMPPNDYSLHLASSKEEKFMTVPSGCMRSR